MKLTGKCKEDFDKWLRENYSDFNVIKYQIPYWWSASDLFYKLPESMQQGVLIDFFDSVGIYICSELFSLEKDIATEFISKVENKKLIWNTVTETKTEARTAAIEKANQIYNESKQDIIREKKV